jgi:hypothetical protein
VGVLPQLNQNVSLFVGNKGPVIVISRACARDFQKGDEKAREKSTDKEPSRGSCIMYHMIGRGASKQTREQIQGVERALTLWTFGNYRLSLLVHHTGWLETRVPCLYRRK